MVLYDANLALFPVMASKWLQFITQRQITSLIFLLFLVVCSIACMQWRHQGGSLNQMLGPTGASGMCPQGSNPVSLTKGCGVQGLSQLLLITGYPHRLPQAHPTPVDPHRRSALAPPHPGPHLARALLPPMERHSTLLLPWPAQSKPTQ